MKTSDLDAKRMSLISIRTCKTAVMASASMLSWGCGFGIEIVGATVQQHATIGDTVELMKSEMLPGVLPEQIRFVVRDLSSGVPGEPDLVEDLRPLGFRRGRTVFLDASMGEDQLARTVRHEVCHIVDDFAKIRSEDLDIPLYSDLVTASSDEKTLRREFFATTCSLGKTGFRQLLVESADCLNSSLLDALELIDSLIFDSDAPDRTIVAENRRFLAPPSPDQATVGLAGKWHSDDSVFVLLERMGSGAVISRALNIQTGEWEPWLGGDAESSTLETQSGGSEMLLWKSDEYLIGNETTLRLNKTALPGGGPVSFASSGPDDAYSSGCISGEAAFSSSKSGVIASFSADGVEWTDVTTMLDRAYGPGWAN